MTSFNLRRATAWVAWGVAASVVACSEPDDDEVFLDDPYAYREHEPDFLSPEELVEFYAVQDATLARYGLPEDASRQRGAPGARPPVAVSAPLAAGRIRDEILAAEHEAAVRYVDVSLVTDLFQLMRTLSRKYEVPYEIVYMMAYQESKFRQFRDWDPARCLISGDGGYGIMQVTPRVLSPTVASAIDLGRLCASPAYNLETGVMLLRAKFDYYSDPARVPIGSPPDPTLLETWYWTVASYNGLSGINNPNAYVDGPRTWHVRDKRTGKVFTFTRTEAYQDAVWSWIGERFGITLSKIPLSEIVASGRPEFKRYDLPQPTHAMTIIESERLGSSLARVTYAAANPDGTLDVDLTGGGGFVFTGVPAAAYYRLMLAEASEQTKDAYFRAAIYPSYPYTEK